MKNSNIKLNELISDLSEPARSIVVVIILLQKIRNHILSLKKKGIQPLSQIHNQSHSHRNR